MNESPLSATDNRLLRDWRRGTLDPQAAAELEARLFFEPQLLEAARVDRMLADGLAGQAARPATPAPRRRPSPWWLALAATVGAAAMLPLALRPGVPFAGGNVEFVSLDVTRGSAEPAPLRLQPGPAAGLIALRMPAPPGATEPLDLRLVGADDHVPALTVTGLTPVGGMLSFGFARDALAPGGYRVELRRGSQVWQPSSFALDYRPGG